MHELDFYEEMARFYPPGTVTRCRWWNVHQLADLPWIWMCDDCGVFMLGEEGTPVSPVTVRLLREVRLERALNEQVNRILSPEYL